jgi:hypothetical protein
MGMDVSYGMIVLSFYGNCEAEFRRIWESLPPRCPELREVNAAVEEMRSEHDPLASHIFIARHH